MKRRSVRAIQLQRRSELALLNGLLAKFAEHTWTRQKAELDRLLAQGHVDAYGRARDADGQVRQILHQDSDATGEGLVLSAAAASAAAGEGGRRGRARGDPGPVSKAARRSVDAV